ncbi:MAG: NAD-dependent succinate-semialdehyde dehydrogenase [Acidimicrobiales bacterium]
MSTSTTINPTTGEEIATYDDHTDADVEAIVDAAQAAFGEWRRRPLEDRTDIARRIAVLLRKRSGPLAQIMTDEMGKVLAHGEREVSLCAQICEWTADNAADELADEDRPLDGGRAIISYRPVGIILGIQPFNFPTYQVIRYSIPQLVAGNAVLLKHSHGVWGSALFLEQLYHDAGVPEDLFRVLKISSEQSSRLIANPLVRGVTLTGSGKAGSIVAAAAGEHLKKTVMELGSNDAYLVLGDADIPTAVEVCATARIYNNGETCVAAKRFVVVDSVYDEFVAAFIEQLDTIEMGDPNEEATGLGPMAREDLRDELHEQVRASIEAGATLTMGGTVPDRPGFFYPVTVLEDVVPGMPAYDEELFGPVASIIRVADDAEAMKVANDSRFGLGGGIISKDVEKAIAMAIDEFDTGMVNINGYNLANPHLPFGGVKDSGYGREHGGFGLKEFVNVKSVQVTDS